MAHPQLLVSVREVAEVAAALDGGAEWIDLKEPDRGALGAVDVEVASKVVSVVAGRCPISAALGEIADWPTGPCRQLLEVPGIEVVKLGLHTAACDPYWQDKWLEVAEVARTQNKELAAVIYADWQLAAAPSPIEVLEVASDAGCQYLLIDTFGKQEGLLRLLDPTELKQILSVARVAGLSTLVAGGLSVSDLRQLPLEVIDRIAVRGGICRNGRTGTVDRELVMEFSAALRANQRPHMVNRSAVGVSE